MKTTSKKILFSIFTFFLAITLFISIELFVRLLHPEYKNDFLKEVTYDDIQWYQINRSYLKKYFSSTDVLIPELKPQLFRKTKTEKTFRIICLGESSMFGVPYQLTATIPGILRRQLRHVYPEKEIEVINLGASAINSNVILHLSKKVLDLSPDAVLIYTGHNEFYGPDGIGASWLEKIFPFLIQWKYSLKELAIVQLFESNSHPQVDFQNLNLMKQVSHGASVDIRSDEARRVLKNFENNLRALISTFTSQHIPVIVSDITSNILFPPFQSEPPEVDLKRYEDIVPNADTIQQEISRLTKEHLRFPTSASLMYSLGILYFKSQRYDSAKYFLRMAREYDLLKFRAPLEVNTIIKNISSQLHVPYFSADSVFTRYSRNGIPDTSLFWEHLHPKPLGYYLIANSFTEALQRNNILPRTSTPLLPFNTDSLHICWLDLAFGDLTIKSLTSKWPFKDYHVSTHHYPPAPPALKHIVDEVYQSGKVLDQACYETAQIFWTSGRINDAITTYRSIIDEYPYNFYAHYLLANILNQVGKLDESIKHYQISITSNERYPYPKAELGLIQINKGNFDKAIALLNEALSVAQQENLLQLQSTIYYGLATAFANKRDFHTAMTLIEQSLRIMPTNQDAMSMRRKIESLLKN